MNATRDLPWQPQVVLQNHTEVYLNGCFFVWKRKSTEFYIHSEWEKKNNNKPKAPDQSITELNWRKKQLSKHRKKTIISYFFSPSALLHFLP